MRMVFAFLGETNTSLLSGIKWNYFILPFVLFTADLLVVYGTMMAAMMLVAQGMGQPVWVSRSWGVWLTVLYMSNLLFADLYRTRRVLADHARKIFKASGYAVITIVLADFLLHMGGTPLSRGFLVLFWLLSFWGLYAERCLLRAVFSRLGMWKSEIVVIGAGKTAEKFVKAFGAGVDIVGFVEDNPGRPLLKKYPHLGGFADIEQVLREHPVYEVLIAAPGLSKARTIQLFYEVQPYTKHVSLIPDLFGVPIGKDGTTFRCYKFRSMYVNADAILRDYLDKNPEAQREWQEFQKLRGEDPRVTKVGRFIRKYSIDELPQIFNVLEGNMSLVGPRPYLPREREDIGEYMPVICMTTPGMTGLWQVSGRSNVKFSGRLKMDSWYVRNWNLWTDIVILFKTVRVVLGRDAY